MKIPFHKPCITDRDVRAVVKCLRNGWLTMGNMTIEFENAFKKYVGSHYTVAVSSGTAALHLALEAIGLKEGDEVIVPAMTFTSTAEVVCYFKAKPVFVDIEKSTGNIDVSQIEKKITKRTKAIIPVDYAGQPADLNDIKRIANKNNLFIIVDAAHSLSSYYKGKRISRAADMTCFSFYATKTLTTGEGGMVATNNKRWAERIRIMRLHGISRDAWKRRSSRGGWYYEVVSPGYKYNISDMQSALGIEQLKKVDSMWRKRTRIAERYNKAFRNIEEVTIPYIKGHRQPSWHLYVIQLNIDTIKISRNQCIEQLKKTGVCVGVHFIPLYRHPFYRKKFGYAISQFPNCEWVYKRIISLPIYPSMTKREVTKVIKAVTNIVSRNRR